MATKTKNGLQAVMHTAGIYSDMTVDGPEIGTLVVIVDRAKNLPNRKSIGKQDPYCAARLGKEAKKTDTDRRGGQTPKWDQELRFTVHDSPDYYQMKVSVFNDDKKTDLIGETWVNLQDVIVQGGGQSDVWHNLQCRGKYAGEIRIEITYYDSRPKEEKVATRVKQTEQTGTESPRDSLSGPRQPKPPVKRRPLPSDPTGASPSPVLTPDHIQTPPPRGFQTPEKYISTQSPLQSLEYNTAIPRNSEPRHHDSRHTEIHHSEPRPHHQPHVNSHGSSHSHSSQSQGPPPGMVAYTPAPPPMQGDRYEIYDPQRGDEYIPGNVLGRREEPIEYERNAPPLPYEPQHVFEAPPFDEYNQPPSPGGPPPPPPAHRSHHASPAVPSLPQHNSYHEMPPQNNRFGAVLQETQRHSMPAFSSPDTYQAYSPPKGHGSRPSYGAPNEMQQSPPRHHSYDDRYNVDYSAMQPSVEDAPPSPSPFHSSANHTPQYNGRPQYDDRRFDQAASPAPLNLSGRGSAQSGRQSAVPSHSSYNSHMSTGSPISYRSQNYMNSDVSSRTTYSQQSQPSQYSQPSQSSQYSQKSHHHRQSEDHAVSPGGHVPPLPSTLVAGMDPFISQEISERIYQDNRGKYSQNTSTPPRGRYQESPHHRQQYSQSQPRSDYSQPFVPAAASHDDHQMRMSTGTYTPVVKPRAISPNPATPNSIPRKSVSPSPMHTEQRRLSGVPFGPDAFDILNPNVSPGKPVESSTYNSPAVDPEAKIIMHDGREVDPSDHLPEHSWAPEPEARTPKKQQEASRSHQSPIGAQPMPASGRRQLRMAAGRPHSMSATAHSSPMYMSGAISDPNTPAPSSARNRLQKKSNRQSAQPAPQSSPLAPISPYQDSTFNARSMPRAHTMDFGGENGYGSGSPTGYRGNPGPSIPPKIPMGGAYGNNYGPPPPPPEESAWALLEEMKSIDLGNGKGRRKRWGSGNAA